MNEKLRRIFAETLGLNPAEITEALSAENTVAWDSVAHLNLILSIEQEFGQRFSPKEFLSMQSFSAIREKLAERGMT